MPHLYLVRHGRATAGWDVDPDPGIDEIGQRQAEQMTDRLALRGPLPVISSPLQRCQETAHVLCQRWGIAALVQPAVGEIPSPLGVAMTERVEWLRLAMAGRWSQLDNRYQHYRASVVAALTAIVTDTVVVSHFVAINVAIGQATGDDRVVIRSLDNCSITVMDCEQGQLRLVEGGHEADTLIR